MSESKLSMRKRVKDMTNQIREMHLKLAEKDLESISNVDTVVALQQDRDRFLRFTKRVAKANTKQLFKLQRLAQQLLKEE